MTDGASAFIAGVMVAAVAYVVLFCLMDPWHSGYCTAACGSAGVVEVSQKVCTCGPEDAPVALKIREGK